MASTYTLISSNVLGSATASVTFSSIPSTYTDLVLCFSSRGDNTVQFDSPYIRFNSDTTNLNSRTNVSGDGSAASSARAANQSFANVLTYAGNANSATANTFGSAEVYIPNYTSTTSKPFSLFGVTETNATGAYMAGLAGLYRNTSALTTILLLPNNQSTFLTGSSFYLYGIKNS
jgi:hypothetical protein